MPGQPICLLLRVSLITMYSKCAVLPTFSKEIFLFSRFVHMVSLISDFHKRDTKTAVLIYAFISYIYHSYEYFYVFLCRSLNSIVLYIKVFHIIHIDRCIELELELKVDNNVLSKRRRKQIQISNRR